MTMLEKDPRMPWISPMLVVKDVDASLKKYADAFGFEIGTAMQEEGKTTYGDMMHKGQMVLMFMLEKSWGNPALTPANSKTDSPVSLYVYVDNVDEQFVNINIININSSNHNMNIILKVKNYMNG